MKMSNALGFQQDQVLTIIIFLAVLAFPISFISELGAMFEGIVPNSGRVVSSFLLKGYKDVVIVLLILFCAGKTIKRGSLSKLKFCWLSALFLLILPILGQSSLKYMLFGLRWANPMILTALMIGFVDRKLVEKVGKAVLFLFFLHFITQVYQAFWMLPFFGKIFFGLTRAPGLFAIANTGALFTVLSAFFAMHYSTQGRVRSVVLLMAPFSLMLAASGTGIIVGLFLYLLFALRVIDSMGSLSYRRILRMLIIILLSIAPVITFMFLDDITGREGYVKISGGSRVNIFLNELASLPLLSDSFGLATNTAILGIGAGLVENKGARLVDSMVTSSIVNLGLPIAMLFLILPLVSVMQSKSELIPRLSFLFVIGLFSSITIIAEIFPANLLCAVLLAYFSTPPRRSRRLSNMQVASLINKRTVN